MMMMMMMIIIIIVVVVIIIIIIITINIMGQLQSQVTESNRPCREKSGSWMDEQRDKDGQMDQLTDKQLDRWRDTKMGGETDGWMDRQTYRQTDD